MKLEKDNGRDAVPRVHGRAAAQPYRTTGRDAVPRVLAINHFPFLRSLLPSPFVLAASLLLALGCASPRVVEVTSRTRLQDIDVVDQYIFLHDRASRIHYEPKYLPADVQRQEFFVRWAPAPTSRSGPATVGLVKFEYRQVDKPNTLREQTYVPQGDCAKVFEVRGEEFRAGGPVSAWRVSLWNGESLLAEKKSALW